MSEREKIYYTDGDWSVRWYERNVVTQLCHTHNTGITCVIPFGFTRDNEYRCHECGDTAPQGARAIWIFCNMDRFNE